MTTWGKSNSQCNWLVKLTKFLSWKSLICGWDRMRFSLQGPIAVWLSLWADREVWTKFTGKTADLSLTTSRALLEIGSQNPSKRLKMPSVQVLLAILSFATFCRSKIGIIRIFWLTKRAELFTLTSAFCFQMRLERALNLKKLPLSWHKSSLTCLAEKIQRNSKSLENWLQKDLWRCRSTQIKLSC